MIDKSSLPVGSCVRIFNCNKMVMIAGFLPYDDQRKKTYDYIGIYIPIGIRKPRVELKLGKDYIFISNDNIDKVVFVGFSDNKYDFYHKYLLNINEKFSNMNQNDLSKDNIKKLLIESLPSKKVGNGE